MDRRVKERLIGATILVALIVLLVPEFLSGPKPKRAPAAGPVDTAEPVRNVTVDLATSKATEAPQPELNGAAASAPEQPPPPAAPPPATETATPPIPLETPSSPPRSGTAGAKSGALHDVEPAEPARRGWSVQLGSFASRSNVDKLARQLKTQGYAVYVVSTGSGTSMRYRVRVGPMPDRGGAERIIAKLKAQGHSASVVLPPP